MNQVDAVQYGRLWRVGHMVMELVVESAVAALLSALATDAWPRARERIARALRPADPAGESATLDLLVTGGDDAGQRAALRTHLIGRLRENPERIDDFERGIIDVDPILVEAHLVRVDAQSVHVHGPANRPSEAIKLAVMHAARAAHELQEMPEDMAISLLAAMPVDAAAKRLALMVSAQDILSNMDERLAADLLTAMLPPVRRSFSAVSSPNEVWRSWRRYRSTQQSCASRSSPTPIPARPLCCCSPWTAATPPSSWPS